MSQTNHSPPKTPRRPIMEIVNDRLAEKSAARGHSALTPPSSKLPQKIRGVSPALVSAGIQVPATPSTSSSPLKESHVIQRHDHADGQGLNMATRAESALEADETIVSLDTSVSKRDLGPMDWSNFEQRYATAIEELNDKEDHLLLEFQNLSEAFQIWADSSAERDNGRAWKRLRTRERYVQIKENTLEEKKQHYLKVVQAFKQAIELFAE
ncbi:hypothetical protein DSL72_008610 [Monilinia vaccinii-corymbosi]|uniref:Uncharacterized protein n=1 Tax=Monilinia vaccinii-corymbosi TaxID=61207 RepID=A0A8A3PPR7_9HELO|nr:hypothetical protein DSL72_008610 [Monilinia vaccinii-corymbosi]